MGELRIPLRKDFQTNSAVIAQFLALSLTLTLEFIISPPLMAILGLESWVQWLVQIVLSGLNLLFALVFIEAFLRAKFVDMTLILNEQGIGNSASSQLPVPWFNVTRINPYSQLERIEIRAFQFSNQRGREIQKTPASVSPIRWIVNSPGVNLLFGAFEASAAHAKLVSQGAVMLYMIPKEGTEAKYVHMGRTKFKVPYYNLIIERKDVPRIKKTVAGRVPFIE